MKKILYVLFVICLIQLVCSESYGSGVYGENIYVGIYCGDGTCNNDETCSSCQSDCGACSAGSESGSEETGGSSLPIYECSSDKNCKENQKCINHTCVKPECLNDSSCNNEKGEACINYECKKLFDIKITDHDSEINLGEFFNFTYRIETTEINGSVKIFFWIEQNGIIIFSGEDIFINLDEKTNGLYLPENMSSGDYEFFIKANHSIYNTSAYETLEIKIDKGIAKIGAESKWGVKSIFITILLGIIALGIILYSKRRRKRNFGY